MIISRWDLRYTALTQHLMTANTAPLDDLDRGTVLRAHYGLLCVSFE